MATPYATKLASLAKAEFDRYHEFHETQQPLLSRIKEYWTDTGFGFPGIATPWAAIFVSFLVKSAGATAAEFHFAPSSATFVFRAIRDARNGVGVFHGRRIADYGPKIGDIVQNNRMGNTFDFDYAAAHSDYPSHTAIVVEEGADEDGRYVKTVGGNEADTVGDKIIRLTPQGLITPPAADPARYICIVQTLK